MTQKSDDPGRFAKATQKSAELGTKHTQLLRTSSQALERACTPAETVGQILAADALAVDQLFSQMEKNDEHNDRGSR
jgi:hypothetical protein